MSDNFNHSSWKVVVAQKDTREGSFGEFSKQFTEKTNLTLIEFVENEAAEVESTDTGVIWVLGKFRLVSDCITNLYSLEEYI